MRSGENFVVVMAALAMLMASSAAAQTESVIYSFDDASAGFGGAFGAGGVLYGSAFGGSTGSFVYQLIPGGNGAWTETNFCGVPNSGNTVTAPYVVVDGSGNVYGTVAGGGAYGVGAVFELSPSVGGGCATTILHSFSTTGKDGNTPVGWLTFDVSGNIYGATEYGGEGGCVNYYNGCGTVFELSPHGSGGWSEKILHAFTIHGEDGNYPVVGLAIDNAGNLYGTTMGGGVPCGSSCVGYGTAFELMPVAGGAWKEKMLHRFDNNGKDGYQPWTGLILDASGNVYGTTSLGGIFGTEYSGGVAFELIPQPDGGWNEVILHNFGNAMNGVPASLGRLSIDSSGNLYGTTASGGTNDEGAVYRLSPSAGGKWSETVLHNFDYAGGDGAGPNGFLTFDSSGNIYGTTQRGGEYGEGTVYEVTP